MEARELLKRAGLEETEENLDVAKVEIAVNRKSKVRDKIKAVLDEPNKKIRGWKPTPKNKKIQGLTKDSWDKMMKDFQKQPLQFTGTKKEIISVDINMLPVEYNDMNYGTAKETLEKFSEDFGLQDYILIPCDMSKQNMKHSGTTLPPFTKL